MDYLPWLIIALVVVLLIFLSWLFYKLYKKRMIRKEIEKEAMDLFNEAERRYAQSNGESNPYTIIWEITEEQRRKNRYDARTVSPNITTEPTTREIKLDTELVRREDIQSGTSAVNEQHSDLPRQPEQNNTRDKKRFFGLFRQK